MKLWKPFCRIGFNTARAEDHRGIFFWSDNFRKSHCRHTVGFIMLRLVRVVSQFPAQYSGRLPGFNLWKLTRLWGVFFPPFVGHLLNQTREHTTWGEITSRRLQSLIGWLSFLLVPNMVLSKMNAHEHRTKQTYESYTFQPLTGFCVNSKQFARFNLL